MDSRIQRQMIIWTVFLVMAVGAINSLFIFQPPSAMGPPSLVRRSPDLLERSQEDVSTPLPSSGLGLDVRRGQSEVPPNSPNSPASSASPASQRIPASARLISPDGRADALEIPVGCKDSSHELAPNIKQVRLTGSFCSRSLKATARLSEVINEANGVAATVFYPGPNSFTTDYLSLRDGKNRFTVSHSFNDGTTEKREIVVRREPATDPAR